jgi:hypothetical protein
VKLGKQEMSFNELQPHQIRVIEEQTQVDGRLKKLSEFLNKGRPENISNDEWEDLILQEESMDSYNEILKRRINRFLNK